MMTKKKVKSTNCECCGNYVYDEDYGYYVCEMDLDQDEMRLFLTGRFQRTPNFQNT